MTMEAVKALTRDQLESRKEEAVRFTRDVVGDPDRAEEIAEETWRTTPSGGRSKSQIIKMEKCNHGNNEGQG